MVVANMIGTGVFTSLGSQLTEIRSAPAILLLWAAGGAFAFSGAASYPELGSALPQSGGEYSFLSGIYHPSVGYVSGCVTATVGFAAPTALAAMTFDSARLSDAPRMARHTTRRRGSRGACSDATAGGSGEPENDIEISELLAVAFALGVGAETVAEWRSQLAREPAITSTGFSDSFVASAAAQNHLPTRGCSVLFLRAARLRRLVLRAEG